jgi:hypothetical protein
MNKRMILAVCVAVVSAACGRSAPTETGTQGQPAAAQPAAVSQPAAAEPSRTNELPFGKIDQPQPDAAVKGGKVVVSGWAVDDTSVKEVRVYVDSRFFAVTKLSIPRDDLKAQLPGYMHGSAIHGWSMDINLAASPGSHEILAQAVDDQGATRDLGSVKVTVSAE